MKTCIWTILLISISTSIGAQIISPMLGINYGSDNERDIGFRHVPSTRLVAGVGTELEFTPAIDFLPSLLYSIKGGAYLDGSNNPVFKEFSTYLAIPLLFDYNLDPFGINLGLVASYWVSERTKFFGANGRQISILNFNDPTINAFGHYNRLELAVEVGARYRLETAGVTMNFYLSYKHALTPQYQPDNPPTNYPYLFNRWLQLKVGVPIRISA